MKRSSFFPVRTLFFVNLAFWLTLGLLEILQMYLYSQNYQEPFKWERHLTFNIPFFISLWILSFPLFQLFLRVRHKEWPQVLRIYLPAGIVFGCLHMVTAILVGMCFKRMISGPTMPFIEAFLLNSKRMFPLIISGFLMFWLMIIILSALNYYRRYKGQSLRSAELESRLTQSQLQALKMQLHPHFLFNALNTIAMMVRREKGEQAVEMISGLSDLLRQSLSHRGEQFVPLKEELALLQKYLRIEQVRFQDKLHIQYDIDPESRQVPIPSLLLQPLLENAFKHGISQSMGNTEIQISSQVSGEFLTVAIQNSGPFLPPGWSLQHQKGIGLRNTQSRLRQLYPDNFRLLVRNAAPTGVLVEIRIPVSTQSTLQSLSL